MLKTTKHVVHASYKTSTNVCVVVFVACLHSLSITSLKSLFPPLAVCVFVLGKRLGCLEQEIPPDCQVFIDGLHNFLDASQRLLFGLSFHKFVTTKAWKDLAHSQKQVYDIAMEHMKEKVQYTCTCTILCK